MNKCMVCEEWVIHGELLDQFTGLFERVDTYGIESLTEREQMVYEGHVCSQNCYKKLYS